MSSYTLKPELAIPKITLNQKKLKFLVTGGTGFIGTRLCQSLIIAEQEVTILTRDKEKAASKFKGKIKFIDNLSVLDEHFDIVINLAGESLTDGRWSPKKKKALFTSRLGTTQALIEYIARVKDKPQLLISGSAIGYYGHSLDQVFTESSQPIEKDIGHELCRQWEETANQAKLYGVRVCCLRTGIVLGKEGGALAKMLFPFNICLGGKMGEGKQWMSWIHIDDLIGIIVHIINLPTLDGPINGTAPFPVTNAEFTRTLGKVMRRPTLFNLPSFILKLAFGEMAEIILLNGQKVMPTKMLENKYEFEYKSLEEALSNIFFVTS